MHFKLLLCQVHVMIVLMGVFLESFNVPMYVSTYLSGVQYVLKKIIRLHIISFIIHQIQFNVQIFLSL